MHLICKISLFFLLICSVLQSEVLIITHAYNRPDFIELQIKLFRKLLKDEFRFVVFNDAVDKVLKAQIENICFQYEIECVAVPQEIHELPYLKREPGDPLHRPNIRHCNCIQYSLDTLGFSHQGPVAIVDSDIFLIRPLSIEELLKDWEIVASTRGAENRVYYLWPGLTFIAMDRIPEKETLNFNCGVVNGAIVDSGGHTYEYLTTHPEVRLLALRDHWGYELFCPDRFAPDHLIDLLTPIDQQIERLKWMGFNDREIQFLLQKPHTINFAGDKMFLHYRAGTNYDNQTITFEKSKSEIIMNFLNRVLQDD